MKQNAAEKALANLDDQIAVLSHARAAILAAMPTAGEPSADKPKRGRKRKAGLPNGAADSAKE